PAGPGVAGDELGRVARPAPQVEGERRARRGPPLHEARRRRAEELGQQAEAHDRLVAVAEGVGGVGVGHGAPRRAGWRAPIIASGPRKRLLHPRPGPTLRPPPAWGDTCRLRAWEEAR